MLAIKLKKILRVNRKYSIFNHAGNQLVKISFRHGIIISCLTLITGSKTIP